MNFQQGTGPVPLVGPLDIEQIVDRNGYVDFGRILVPASIPALVIKGEMEQDTQRLVAITLELADSVLQVSVFSAARSEDVWPEVRAQLEESLSGQGAKVEAIHSSLGAGLDVSVPAVAAKTLSLPERLRFVGTDGPRWFLRGSISGAALANPAANDEIEALYRSLVIDRGTDPIPPRELLTLDLPAGNVPPPRQL